ncbi:hypothetical protein O9H85_32865 [Paenibacillus filicis]|uniref:Uncharacterized protein n=1 Tax=Paenibacillus gyeongsangnamensis TaxID=3388067 RepID=A0ABT4QJK9_9BACL|nr:hypothetical protein [Paenibacillus filicis]MCZ8517061.1 hypothetical protein [Paenibacillus filicis]
MGLAKSSGLMNVSFERLLCHTWATIDNNPAASQPRAALRQSEASLH